MLSSARLSWWLKLDSRFLVPCSSSARRSWCGSKPHDSRFWCRAHHQLGSHGVALSSARRALLVIDAHHQLGSHGVALNRRPRALLGVVLIILSARTVWRSSARLARSWVSCSSSARLARCGAQALDSRAPGCRAQPQLGSHGVALRPHDSRAPGCRALIGSARTVWRSSARLALLGVVLIISSVRTVWRSSARLARSWVSCSHRLGSHGVALKRTTRAPGCRAHHQLGSHGVVLKRSTRALLRCRAHHPLGSHGVALSSARLALLGVVLSSARLARCGSQAHDSRSCVSCSSSARLAWCGALKRTTRAPGCRAHHQLGSHGGALKRSTRAPGCRVLIISSARMVWRSQAHDARSWVSCSHQLGRASGVTAPTAHSSAFAAG